MCFELGLSSCCCELNRRNCRDPGILLIASRGDGDAAAAVVEECTATIQDYNGTFVRT